MSRVGVAARAWIGTPFQHGASRRGLGTDCLGLVRGLYRELVGPEPITVPPYPSIRTTGVENALMAGLEAALRSVVTEETTLPGDVLAFGLGRVGTCHLGVSTRGGSHPLFVHALERHGVVETSLSKPWSRRIAARFRFPLKD